MKIWFMASLEGINKSGVFLIPFLFFGVFCHAQEHYLLDSFKAIKDKNRVILLWTMKKGSTCIGTGILRSTDGINFEKIGEVSEVCGDLEKQKTYQYIDQEPVIGATNYYVLELGFSGKTEPPVKTSFRDFGGKSSIVIANPGKNVTIYFNNPDQDLYTFRLYSSIGNPVFSANTRAEELTIEPELFSLRPVKAFYMPDHFYVYVITGQSGNIITSGKLCIIGF